MISIGSIINKKNPGMTRISLLPNLLMDRMLAAPRTELLQLDFPFHAFLIFPLVIIQALAGSAPQFDEFFREFSLCHVLM